MPIYLTALGTVTAYNTVTVKSRVDGQLLSVNVKEGQQVRMGQLIAQIDPRPYLAVEAQAEGQLAKDLAAADFSKSEAGRYTALYEAGVISKESEQTQVSNANARRRRPKLRTARPFRLPRSTSPTPASRRPSTASSVCARFDAGNIVHAADTNGLIVVTQLQPITVIFTLPEDQLQQVLKLVRAGHKLVVDAFDRSETSKLATGTLLTVDNQIDTTTGTVKVKAVFDNKDGALFPNQFVNVRLILDDRAQLAGHPRGRAPDGHPTAASSTWSSPVIRPPTRPAARAVRSTASRNPRPVQTPPEPGATTRHRTRAHIIGSTCRT